MLTADYLKILADTYPSSSMTLAHGPTLEFVLSRPPHNTIFIFIRGLLHIMQGKVLDGWLAEDLLVLDVLHISHSVLLMILSRGSIMLRMLFYT